MYAYCIDGSTNWIFHNIMLLTKVLYNILSVGFGLLEKFKYMNTCTRTYYYYYYVSVVLENLATALTSTSWSFCCFFYIAILASLCGWNFVRCRKDSIMGVICALMAALHDSMALCKQLLM